MLKKTAIGFIVLIVFLMVVLSFIGYTPNYLYHTPGVATGIGAKLACSSRFVSGLTDEQAFQDIVDYSPILSVLDLEFDASQQSVTSTFLGIWSATASYRSGLGCSLEYEGYTARNNIKVPELKEKNAPWPLGNQVDTIDNDIQKKLESILKRDNEAGLASRALLVVKDGSIIAEAYAPGIGPESQLLGWSMGKSITSIFVGHLVYTGKIRLSDDHLFQEWEDDDRAAITVEHLLTMTDGLDFSEVYQPGDDSTAMLFTEPDMAAYTISQDLAHPPGTFFSYSSGTANILAKLVQRDSGGNLQASLDYLTENVYKPMGIANALFETDASGTFIGSSYFYASARDWARAGQLMLNGGILNGHRILSEEYVELAVTPNQSKNEKRYGFQFWLNSGGEELRWPDLPADSYAAQGNRQQKLMIIPTKQMVIVRLGWTKGDYPTNKNFSEIVGAIQ